MDGPRNRQTSTLFSGTKPGRSWLLLGNLDALIISHHWLSRIDGVDWNAYRQVFDSMDVHVVGCRSPKPAFLTVLLPAGMFVFRSNRVYKPNPRRKPPPESHRCRLPM